MIEVKRVYGAFDFKNYVNVDLDTFFASMVERGLISKLDGEEDETVTFSRGDQASDFETSLSDDMEWMIDSVPMSTRGFFDSLKQDPDRHLTLDFDDVIKANNSGDN